MPDWPKGIVTWQGTDTLYISVPFTWLLADARRAATQGHLWKNIKQVRVGGPAVELMPGYLRDLPNVAIGGELGHVLQLYNSHATMTTRGCRNKCGWCPVPKIEGKFRELADWPDKPIICDNDILSASPAHFDRVCDRLDRWGWADFNQGLNVRKLDDHHVDRLRRLRVRYRLALDLPELKPQWEAAFARLRRVGVPLRDIGSLVLIGWNSGPEEAWKRCRWIEGHGVHASPMWFHDLNALEKNQVTPKQGELGWDDFQRRRIMQYFYKHRIVTR